MKFYDHLLHYGADVDIANTHHVSYGQISRIVCKMTSSTKPEVHAVYYCAVARGLSHGLKNSESGHVLVFEICERTETNRQE